MRMRLSGLAAASAIILSMVVGPMAGAQGINGVCVNPPSDPGACARAYGGGNTGGAVGGGQTYVPTVDPAQQAADQGDRALDAGNLQAALEAYSRALHHNPNHGHAWHGLGIVYTKQNDIQRALGAFQRAASLGVPNARENYDKLLKYQKDTEAEKKAVAEQNVNYGKWLIRQGMELGDPKKFLEARHYFRTALNYDPTNADARAAETYIAALERERSPPRTDPRVVAQKDAFARARTGDPKWVKEVTDEVARKLNDRSISAGGMAWAEALLGKSAMKSADADSNADLSSQLADAFWSSSRKRASATVDVSVPGVVGVRLGNLPPPVTGEMPPFAELPAVEKARKGRPLDGKDLASLEAAHAAAVRAAPKPAPSTPTAPAEQPAARERVQSIEIEMVMSNPDAPRQPRFIEPPPPVVPK